MSFFTSIIQYLNTFKDWLEKAYLEVRTWISPFDKLASPLYFCYNAVHLIIFYCGYFNDWLVATTNKLKEILNISTIFDYFQTWIDYATDAYDWVVNAFNKINTILTAWWGSQQIVVMLWIEQAKQWALAQVNHLANSLTPLQNWWNSFVASIPTLTEILSWFTNWWGNVLSKLTSWWNERLLDVKALLTNLALELSPFWEGWQDIRTTVFTFFSNPFDWLLNKFTDWFLGVE